MRFRSLILLSLLASGLASPLRAQQPAALQQADSLLAAGDYLAADRAYSALLATDGRSVRGLLGRATARAWDGRLDSALADYDEVLDASPGHVEALIGAAYAQLWSGRHAEGSGLFNEVLETHGEHFEAEKGLGFAALWSGAPRLAVERFRELVQRNPEHPDAHAGLAQAYLAAREPGRALAAASDAEALVPGRQDVRDVRWAARRAPSMLDVTVVAGSTVFDGTSSSPDSGPRVRAVEATFRPTSDVTLQAQYDNGISVDTRALALSGASVPTYRGSVISAWGGRFISRVGAGSRSLPGTARQSLFEIDQVAIFGRVAVSAGWTGVTQSGTDGEQGFRTGASVSLNARWEAAVNGFRRDVAVGSDGWTIVTSVTHRFEAPVDLTSGVALGHSAVTGLPQNEVYGHAVARMWGAHGLSMTLRRQFGAGTEAFTVVAAGFTLGVGRG